MSTPMSKIFICSDVKLNNRYQNTIYFEDRTAQSMYFLDKCVKTYTNYTYLRKHWDIKVEATMEEARTWNYLFFTNDNTTRYYYYFITDIEYVNDSVVLLSLEMDVMQTYHFDYQLLPSFIERHHTPTDGIGEYLIDEGLDTGEFINAHSFDSDGLQGNCVLVLSSVDFRNSYGTATGTYINGVYSALKLYAFDNTTMLNALLLDISNAGFADGIVSMWMYPKNLVKIDNEWTDTNYHEVTGTVLEDFTVGSYTQHKSKLFEGYTPKNNKLYTYPYNYLYCTNNSGTSAVYRWELFSNPLSAITFNTYGALTPEGTVKIAPDQYKGTPGTNYDEGISLGGFPSCAWNADTYKVWLAQNINSLNVAKETITINGMQGAISGAGQALGGIASLNVGQAASGGAAIGASLVNMNQQHKALMAQIQDRQVQPAQARGSFSTNVNVASGRQTFSFYYKCPRKEYAKAIDDYFTMYGYRVNKVDTPNRKNRKRFTYVKTVGCNLKGQMCDADTVGIARIFDNGITFWVDGDAIGTYLDPNPTL